MGQKELLIQVVQRPRLDIPYLREWAARLGVEADLDALDS